MKIKRTDHNKLLFIAVISWIVSFAIISYRILSTIDEKTYPSKVKHVLDIAGRVFIPDVVNHHPYEEQMRAEHQAIEMNQILQVVPPQSDKKFKSVGEMGSPVIIDVEKLTPEEKKKYDKGWADHAFNEFASSMISSNRQFLDFRHELCKSIKYKNYLPKTSVIIIFHNEAWSALLRTIHSVQSQSPSEYLEEIILVDDASDKEYLGDQLYQYIQKLKNVRLLRQKVRSGLITARIAGADAAKGEALIFLDSHCEVTTGWLEPLLDILDKNRNASAVPIIQTISDTTLSMNKINIEAIQVGGFGWDLIFNWHAVPQHERLRRKHITDPIRSPAMAGGLFAIRKDWFEKLGKYDSGMKIWGGENIELSLKLWMCGGELVTSPCSIVGHIFRKRSPYIWPKNENVVLRNTMRVALVWLDDYLPYFMNNVPKSKQNPNLYGNLSDRFELRRNLQCKGFSYFHKIIYPELFIPGEMIQVGQIRNEKQDWCLDSHGKKLSEAVIAYPCHNELGPQLWYLSNQNEIRKESLCLDYPGGLQKMNNPDTLIMYTCHHGGGNQHWIYTDNKLIRHSSDLCLMINKENKLTMSTCDANNIAQRWNWSKVKP